MVPSKAPTEQKEFPMKKNEFALLFIPLFIFWFVLFTMPILFFGILIRLLMGDVSMNDGIEPILGSLLSFIFAFLTTHPIINQYNIVRVAENGLYVRVFLFFYKWVFIPWEHIEEVKLSPRLDSWYKPIWVIMVKKLTFIHVLLSEQYLTGARPGIIITSNIKNREKLLDIVQSHVD